MAVSIYQLLNVTVGGEREERDGVTSGGEARGENRIA